MSNTSTIEWTDATWNPVRGCSKISPGCTHCYAATFAHRFEGVPDHAYELGFVPRIVPSKLTEPLEWVQSRMIFVNSMSDLFHESFGDDYIEDVFRTMEAADWHVYQVLTKRSQRMRDLLQTRLSFVQHLSHVWVGVSVENRQHGLPRIEHLRESPAALRWLSIEPLLEDLGEFDLSAIDWVIVGGESGPGCRQMEKEWVIDIRDRCRDASIPFFLKQWGGTRKGKAGRTLDGRTYDEYPQVAFNTVPDPNQWKRLRECARTRSLRY